MISYKSLLKNNFRMKKVKRREERKKEGGERREGKNSRKEELQQSAKLMSLPPLRAVYQTGIYVFLLIQRDSIFE